MNRLAAAIGSMMASTAMGVVVLRIKAWWVGQLSQEHAGGVGKNMKVRGQRKVKDGSNLGRVRRARQP